MTQEVSIVDRAANRWSFLVQKRQGTEGPALVDLDVSGGSPEPSVAGRALVESLESVVAASKLFDVEEGALALVPGELVKEVGEIAVRLCGGNSGQQPETESTMGSEKATKIEDVLSEITEHAVTIAGVLKDNETAESKKLTAELDAIMCLAAGSKGAASSGTEKAAKNRGAVILKEIADRAMGLFRRVSTGKIGRREINEIKRLLAMMKGVAERYPSPQAKTEAEITAFADQAIGGDQAALDAIFEQGDYDLAQTAMSELDSAITTTEEKIAEDEEKEKGKEENGPEGKLEGKPEGAAGETSPEPTAVAAPAAGEPAPEPAAAAPAAEPPADEAPTATAPPAGSDALQALTAQVEEQKGTNVALRKELDELRTKLTKVLETPEDRASRGEAPGSDGGVKWDPLDFPMDFNDPDHREQLRKTGRDD